MRELTKQNAVNKYVGNALVFFDEETEFVLAYENVNEVSDRAPMNLWEFISNSRTGNQAFKRTEKTDEPTMTISGTSWNSETDIFHLHLNKVTRSTKT